MLSEQSANLSGLFAEKALKDSSWTDENAPDAHVDEYAEPAILLPIDPTTECTGVHLKNDWAALIDPQGEHATKEPRVVRRATLPNTPDIAGGLFAPNFGVQSSALIAGTFATLAGVGLAPSGFANLLSAGSLPAFRDSTVEPEDWQVVYIGKDGDYVWEDSDGSGRETTEIEHLVGQLREFPNLHDNWDGYGGVAPDQYAVECAVAFLHLASKEVGDLPVPKTSLAGSGEVGVFWSPGLHGFYGDVGFFADGRMNYYVETKDGQFASEGGIIFDWNKLPDQLINLLKKAVGQQK